MARALVWHDTFIGVLCANGAVPQIVDLLVAVAAPDKRASTVTRTLVRLDVYEGATNSAKGTSAVSLGIGITSQEAFALGETAIPDVNVAGDSPRLGWLWRDFASATGSIDAGNVMEIQSIRADIRAQRKLENGELYFSAQASGIVGAGISVRVQGLIRTLIRLP